ncbi:hypothetical protein MRX96_013903 [Rhipicephalus microplus]
MLRIWRLLWPPKRCISDKCVPAANAARLTLTMWRTSSDSTAATEAAQCDSSWKSPSRLPPVTFSPPPLRTRSAQEPPCISGWGGLWKRTVPCGSLDWLLECDGPLDWDRRRSLDRDLARPLDEVPFRWPWERLLDRDLDLDRLLACCDESRLSTPVAAERLFELELRCAGWLTPSSALAEDLWLFGLLGFSGASTCSLEKCKDEPCLVLGYHIEKPRMAIYVRSSLTHAVFTDSGIIAGELKCCAIPSGQAAWTLSWRRQPEQLGKRAIICGDINSHHSDRGGRYDAPHGREPAEIIADMGLHLLNTGETTVIKRGTGVNTVIDTLTAFESKYSWTTPPNTWGSDHFPTVVTARCGTQLKTRTYKVVYWDKFSNLCREVDDGQSFLESIAACTRAATVEGSIEPIASVPDLYQLNLQASRRQADL